ncbi:hemerythrin domain-containing protein [Paraburkholderia sp. J41]|uniref:hemerythrin domain-containing protein n=1 Tax=Paraburkholderia sp. J41 TaxID=2805433 RepID=UPI002AC3173F|nr:hemerythrin domain-containing protein [Paraburkholderia sp. J41]
MNTSAKSNRTDAIELLTADHRAVEKLFDAWQPADKADEDARYTLVKRACEMLTVHTMIEEELLYPAAAKALPENTLDVDEAFVEHYLVKSLIQRFTTLTPADAGFDATFRVLTELVQHHVKEEEEDLFPQLRKSGLNLEQLGQRMAERKAELDAKLDAAGVRSTGDRTMTLSHRDFPV